MLDTRILIIVKYAEAGRAYADALSTMGVSFDMASSFKEMSLMAMDKAYNGLVIDIVTLVRSSKEEKAIAYDCINIYPVIRVRWEGNTINLSPLEQIFTPDTESALKLFIENRCQAFPRRMLRRHLRKSLNMNVLLSFDATFSAGVIKTFAVNISLGGTFIHLPEALDKGQTVWLRFVEFSDQTPIAATVCWSLAWGESVSIPGVGLRFDRMSEAQDMNLKAILNV